MKLMYCIYPIYTPLISLLLVSFKFASIHWVKEKSRENSSHPNNTLFSSAL